MIDRDERAPEDFELGDEGIISSVKAWIANRDRHYLGARSPVDVLNESSLRTYDEFNRRRRQFGNDVFYSGSASTRAVYRAAWRYEIDATVRILLDELEAASSAIRAQVIQRLAACLRTLKEIEDDACHAQEISKLDAKSFGRLNRQKRKSKRSSLDGLPLDFDLQILNAARNARKPCPHLKALQVLFITGARPAELVIGVHVKRFGEVLRLTITGVKRSELNRSGQDFRVLEFPADHPLADGLATNGQEVVNIKNAKRLTDTVRWYSEKLWPNRRKKLSAYSFRHRFASVLKDSEESAQRIALALGHQTEVSQSAYGSKGTGKRFRPIAAKLLSVKAAQPVRKLSVNRHYKGRKRSEKMP